MIKFIIEKQKEKLPTFGDVEERQFFVSNSGALCQKHTLSAYIVIADAGGWPRSEHGGGVGRDYRMQRILPRVTKIEF